MDGKPWYTSLTVWSILVAGLLEFTKTTLEQVAPGVAVTIAPYIALVIGLIGRARAGQPLSLK